MTYIPKYQIEVRPIPASEGGGYLAWVPDLPGCMSDGKTPADAIANVHDAIREWIEEADSLGQPIPQPSKVVTA